MTDQPADRAAYTYGPDDDDARVGLPGYLNPVPAVVGPGDVVTVDAAYAGDLDADARFTPAANPTPAPPAPPPVEDDDVDDLDVDDPEGSSRE